MDESTLNKALSAAGKYNFQTIEVERAEEARETLLHLNQAMEGYVLCMHSYIYINILYLISNDPLNNPDNAGNTDNTGNSLFLFQFCSQVEILIRQFNPWVNWHLCYYIPHSLEYHVILIFIHMILTIGNMCDRVVYLICTGWT